MTCTRLAAVSSILLTLALCWPYAAMAADSRTITHGDEVDIAAAAVAGKHTLFDFYADWCGPCRSLEPQLASLADRFEDRLAVRKVDIINWQSPVARQYRLNSIPHLKLFDPDGRLVSEGDAPSVLAALDRALGGDVTAGGHSAAGSNPAAFFAVAVLVAIAAAALFLKGKPPRQATAEAAPHPQPVASSSTPQPATPACWFVMLQGSLAGPFTRDQLADLVRRRCVERGARTRRKGDREWQSIDSIL